jgi:protein-S-isoprenylcysteine O-methyltransferase Ste14
MTTVAGVAEGPGRGERWLAGIASLAVGAGFFALWLWLLPPWLGFRVDMADAARWRWIAAVPSVLGFAMAMRCVWDFGWTGRGTPAPMVPPKRPVVVGFYRYVRNPMYVGFCVGWAGLWVVLFVQLYEEPTLRRKFGADYGEYCKHVRRWVPRLRTWKQ